MRTVVFSDIHGNLPAFELMLKRVGSVDQYICLGDVVDYGPWSNECVELLESIPNCVKILGNHDQAFINGELTPASQLAQLFFQHCYPSFKMHDYLKKYQMEYDLSGFTFTHTINDQYIFPETVLDLKTNYFVGHSHHQFATSSNGFWLYNPGSVGQNRRNINVINYSIFDSTNLQVEMQQVHYDADIVIQEMRRQKYPHSCLEYYQSKLIS